MEYTPHEYNTHGIDFLFERKVGALWWEMGLGKTATTATGVTDLMELGMANQTLVVAPLRVAEKSWPDEFRKWDHLNPYPFQFIRGTPTQRAVQCKRDVAFHFINYEQLDWLTHEFQKNWPWDTVVLDESSKIKNQGSVRSKSLKRIRPQIDRLYELTGSPAPNGLKDTWNQIYMMDKGRRLGRTEDAFKRQWFYRDRAGKLQLRGRRAEQEIHARLADICFSALAKDHLDMGKPHYNEIPIDLKSAYGQYAELERKTFLDLEDGNEIDAFNAAALTNKLLQFAGGGVYTERETRKWSEVHQYKIEAVKDIMEEAAGQPVLVAYNFKHELERLQREFPDAVVIGKDVSVIDDWNAGKIKMLLAHPASAGHGLNLQDGGHTIVWFSLNWSLELFEQFNARLHRQGQKSPVIIHMLIAEGTMDEEVWLRLQGKASVQEALMVAMRRRK